MLLRKEIENDPVTNFETVWLEFKEKYGLFDTKSVDWDSVYHVYRPQINNESSDHDLYTVLKAMLKTLNDNHVGMITTDPELPAFTAGNLDDFESMYDFDLSIVTDNYLPDSKFEEPFFTYGILEGNIGYIHIEGFSDLPRNLKKPMDNILEHLNGTKGIIVDIRGGYGGEDIAGQYIAGRFTSNTISYMTTRVKNGPGKNDFTSTEEWQIKPEGDFQYLKPVVVLTHCFTISARETFCLAMKVLPQVTIVGDTTAGAFSNQINREMPNGWGYSISIGEWKTADGLSYEGTGIPPNTIIQNSQVDLLNGIDQTLEEALSILN